MRNVFYLATLSFLFIQCKLNHPDGIIIQGNLENCNSDYVLLANFPRYRGNLNFDNFKSISAKIDAKGNFKLESNNIIDKGKYALTIADKNFSLILFEGDNIKINFDAENEVSSFFVTGNGAGKINVDNLFQFNTLIPIDSFDNIPDFKSYIDSLVESQLLLLDVINNKDTASKSIRQAPNSLVINRIIRETPLSESGYLFLMNKVKMNMFQTVSFAEYLCQKKSNDTLDIDFSGIHFNYVNDKNYKLIDNLNHWAFGNGLDNIILLEYLRYRQEENPRLTCADWNNYWKDSLYTEFTSSFLRTSFKPEIYDAYFADKIASDMTLGFLEEKEYLKFITQCSNEKYSVRVKNYNELLKNSHLDSDYNLGVEKLELNNSSFNSLLNSYKGQAVYVIFWTAQFSGASIIPFLPSIKNFENDYKGQIVVLNICIDEKNNKNLWSTRIIDNDWHSNHYFIPLEENDSIIDKFGCKDIFSFCDGGATFTWIDDKGNITNGIEAPWLLNNKKIHEYLNISVR